MSASARLKYKIVKCTSEDPEFPVSELLTHSSQTKGWQTARFCDFPQEIGLQFETPVHLRQVQFLSHQSKIATKIELFTALPVSGQEQRYEAVTFKRLGYLSLDSNERSQFQARELKSVYVDVSAQFIRILLHKCHVNRYNIVNQVGLIALNCLGEVLGPDLAIGPPPPNPALARGPVANGGPYQPQMQPQPQPQLLPPPQQQQHHPSAEAAADEMRYDAHTLERIRSLSNAKVRAVDAEDYEEAKRCKEMLGRLRQTGLLLRELEDRKRLAVQSEDFDAAKALKVEIERLRVAIERPEQLQPPPNRSSSHPSAGIGGRPPSGGSSGSGRGVPDWAGQNGAQMSAPRGGHQPAMAPSPSGGAGRMPWEEQGQAPDQGGAGPAFSSKRSPSPFGQSPMGAHGAPPSPSLPGETPNDLHSEDASRGAPPRARREGAASPPLPANGGARVARSPPLSAMGGGANGGAGQYGGFDGPSEQPPEQPSGGREGGGAGFTAENHPLKGVPNVEDLAQPEPLNSNFQKEAEPLVALFGEYLTSCVYSKSWNLRDAALQKMTLDLQNEVMSKKDPTRLLACYSQVLKRMIPDKNVQVFLSGASLQQAMCQRLLGRASHLRKAEVQAALDSLMPLLVERLGDSNARVDHAARDAHMDFARCAVVGTPFVAQFLLRPPKKKTVLPKVLVSRLQLLATLVTEAGVQPDSKEGLPLDQTVQLAMEWFKHASSEVRESAVKLVAACYAAVGLPRVEKYLADVRGAQKEIFMDEFRLVDEGEGLGAGNNDGIGSLPSPQKPPARRHEAPGGRRAASSSVPEEPDEPDEAEGSGQAEDDTCQFCGHHDPAFTQEGMDVHYWRECPMLTQCRFCQQVIEICTLATHLSQECEAGADAQAEAQDMLPDHCPFCKANVGALGEERHWRDHLLAAGCAGNPRDQYRQGLLENEQNQAA
ncbi:unnamed protein product [Polarella glacialis]|uniref:TOG domain-containing protein n=1 Tax=Polarella glacialis TaxID=89957 RepID=A0A813J0Z2_POLGL|nr:unnamed protein product [Polarella glacialis]